MAPATRYNPTIEHTVYFTSRDQTRPLWFAFINKMVILTFYRVDAHCPSVAARLAAMVNAANYAANRNNLFRQSLNQITTGS